MKNNLYMCCFFLVFSCKHPSADTLETQRSSFQKEIELEEEDAIQESWNYSVSSSEFEESHDYEEGEDEIYQELELIKQRNERPNILEMQTENGVKYVWIEINGIKLRFIFDTGASSICISLAEAKVLYRQGTLRDEDILGSQETQDATGRISENKLINLRIVKIGNRILENVKALVIKNDRAPLLLGQSALEQFGSIEIDNKNGVIILK